MTVSSTTTMSWRSTLARLEPMVVGLLARNQSPLGMVVPALSGAFMQRTVMKLFSSKFEIINLPVDGYLVSRKEQSRTRESSLLMAINELKDPTLSKEEVDEILVFYGLKPDEGL
ncbi:hypothetical protein [Pseudomonas sp. SDO55104_S430]